MISFPIRFLIMAALLTFSWVTAALPPSKSADNAKAYFIEPVDGAVVSTPFKVVFGLSGIGVAPAGTQVENTGHHHLIIDAPTPKAGEVIPADENHRHFGKGQTETVIDLPKGEHTLQLVLGDFIHRLHEKPVVSEVITITVE